jgi:MYXO-CTERM domain-containing protein
VDAAAPAGNGGMAVPLKDSGIPDGIDASFIDPTKLGEELADECDCAVPGKTPPAGLSAWAFLALLGLVVARRKGGRNGATSISQ